MCDEHAQWKIYVVNAISRCESNLTHEERIAVLAFFNNAFIGHTVGVQWALSIGVANSKRGLSPLARQGN